MPTATGFPALLRAFELALTVEGLRPRTISNYLGDTRRFAKRTSNQSPRKVTAADVREFILEYQHTHAPKTVREMQLALRKFFRFLVAEGEIARDPTASIKLMPFRVVPQPTYSEAEVKQLLLVCETRTLTGARDRAIITVLYDTAVREGELVSMGLPDWELRRVRVSGKTGTRDVPLGLTALQAIDRYVRKWDVSEAPLWRGKKGRLTESGVLQLVRRRCRKADIEHKGVHAFRRAAAAQMKRLGMNDSDILEVCGWRSVEMLRRYTASVASELAQSAHQRFSPGDALTG